MADSVTVFDDDEDEGGHKQPPLPSDHRPEYDDDDHYEGSIEHHLR